MKAHTFYPIAILLLVSILGIQILIFIQNKKNADPANAIEKHNVTSSNRGFLFLLTFV
jgi:preprotein translocase subunit SecG